MFDENLLIRGKVIVGYYVEFIIAVILALVLLMVNRTKYRNWSKAVRKVTASYADSAIALALSVELACAIMLIKKNFGLGSYDFGALTVEIAWIVATLIILPIVNFCWQDLRDGKVELRLCMVSLTFVLFLITFVSRMISTYSHGQIGSGEDAVLDDRQRAELDILCLGNDSGLPSTGSLVVEVFSVGGALWASLIVAAAITDQCLIGIQTSFTKRLRLEMGKLRDERWGLIINVIALVLWSVPQFWALMKLRNSQKQLAANLGEPSGSDEWSFGQILAVVVFLPVFVEVLHQYLRRGKDGNQNECGIHGSVDNGVVEKAS